MIPEFTVSGVLPPFTGGSPSNRGGQSPYHVTMTEVVQRFAINQERINILEGILSYRAKLKSLGIILGYQWLDGSFVENCEAENNRGRPPADIDIVTFAYRPKGQDDNWLSDEEFSQLSDNNDDIFDPEEAKRAFKCDAYYVDFHQSPHMLARTVTYWANLFFHSRVGNLWKGILLVDIDCNDEDALQLLEQKKQELARILSDNGEAI